MGCCLEVERVAANDGPATESTDGDLARWNANLLCVSGTMLIIATVFGTAMASTAGPDIIGGPGDLAWYGAMVSGAWSVGLWKAKMGKFNRWAKQLERCARRGSHTKRPRRDRVLWTRRSVVEGVLGVVYALMTVTIAIPEVFKAMVWLELGSVGGLDAVANVVSVGAVSATSLVAILSPVVVAWNGLGGGGLAAIRTGRKDCRWDGQEEEPV